jgi:hypothetical protein
VIGIEIEIGRGLDSRRSFKDATDEWVWMRIHEMAHYGQPVTVRVTIQTERANLKIGTPCSRIVIPARESCNVFEWEILDIWQLMGMDCSSFTAGGAVFFMQRMRLLFNEPQA